MMHQTKGEVTYVVPVIDETVSLRQTVDTIFRVAGETVYEIMVIIADSTTEHSRRVIGDLEARYPQQIVVHNQTLPRLGGAMREAFSLAKGGWVMLMASDLETDPALIPRFIAKAREGRWDIICGSRWLTAGSFQGYGGIKLLLNWLFQNLLRALYRTRLTDLTYAYRLYRKEVLAGIAWEKLDHSFLLESLLKPLRQGARATEVPCTWKPRVEGVSRSSLRQWLGYVVLALRVRFFFRVTQ
jgi:glycosyltransferase involved in cell wall biosynthesis